MLSSCGYLSAKRRQAGGDPIRSPRPAKAGRGLGRGGLSLTAVLASRSQRLPLSLGPSALDLSPPSRGEVKIYLTDTHMNSWGYLSAQRGELDAFEAKVAARVVEADVLDQAAEQRRLVGEASRLDV